MEPGNGFLSNSCMFSFSIYANMLKGTMPLKILYFKFNFSLKRLHNIEFKCGELPAPGPCGAHPCLNGGKCSSKSAFFSENSLSAAGDSNGDYSCTCPSPPERFSGRHCERDLDPCASSPCLFGGECSSDERVGLFKCSCQPGLSGDRCEFGRHCNPNPCENGGHCEVRLAASLQNSVLRILKT